MKAETVLKIVEASGVTAGEMVLVHFWGDDADKEIANQFVVAVAVLGATPVLLQQSRSINREIFSSGKDSCFDERYFEQFPKYDAVLDVFAYKPVVLDCDLEPDAMNRYCSYMSRLFRKLLECRRFTQLRIPTLQNAEESGLEPQDYIRRMNAAYDIDYGQMAQACQKELQRFAGAARVRIITGDCYGLELELSGRRWHVDAGDGDLPCGEIYIAPLEERTNGEVFFETLYLKGTKYRNVLLIIANGEVCSSSHMEISEYFAALPRENRTVCELGLGMNPNVTELCGYTALDEKMAGTFHIAVGANDMFGGVNEAPDHIDFVGSGRIEVLL